MPTRWLEQQQHVGWSTNVWLLTGWSWPPQVLRTVTKDTQTGHELAVNEFTTFIMGTGQHEEALQSCLCWASVSTAILCGVCRSPLGWAHRLSQGGLRQTENARLYCQDRTLVLMLCMAATAAPMGKLCTMLLWACAVAVGVSWQARHVPPALQNHTTQQHYSTTAIATAGKISLGCMHAVF